ncbi:ScbR family autoregulator-binding transcription factor [Streptomyces pratensis]|uniref:ScbR family autoregulator-binding transcription factor n=1 Tax=Streptomyces pratensis TaxID=1169025 RepID=UPI003015E761
MPKQERSARTRRTLLLAAARSFVQHGYTATTLSNICTETGVTSGGFYFHFAGKAAVAEAVVSSAARTLHRTARLARTGQPLPLQALIDTSHALAQVIRQDAVVQGSLRLADDRHRTFPRNAVTQWQDLIRHLLHRAAQEGALLPHAAPGELATTITATTRGVEVMGRHDPAWLAPATLTTLWGVLLPRLATADQLRLLNPAGTDAVDRAAAGALSVHGPPQDEPETDFQPFPPERAHRPNSWDG